MKAVIERVTTIDGQILYRLFEAVGWIRHRSSKPALHAKIDGISNHTLYLDGPHESAFLEQTFQASTAIFVARMNHEIVGVVRVLSDGLQRSLIYDLVVSPPFQGQGIGRALLSRCIQEFAHTQITLGTATPTMPFYERLGFVRSANYLELPTEAY